MTKKPKIAIVRGKYLNQFEMQNYVGLARDCHAHSASSGLAMTKVVAFASLFPIHESIGFPVKKLPSPMDLPNFPYKLPILNRLMVDAMYLWGLERALKGFDLACTRETYFHFTQQALNAKKRGYVKKVLVTCSETIPFNHESIWGRKKFKQRAIREADHFHCLTQKAKECLIKEGCDPSKITVIGYGIDLRRFKVPRQGAGRQGSRFKVRNKIKILFVGRLVEEKGILELLKAYKDLKKDYKLKLQVIGKGPLAGRVKEAGIFPKALPYYKMPKVYQKADIFVLPSKPTKHWEEYYGMVLLEAMASGLPIVSTKSGAIPEIVGDAGILVKPGSVRELRKALLQLIKVKKKREKLAEKAKKRAVKFFDAQKQMKKIWALYGKVLNE